jgi:hypothetical protein
MGFGPIDFNEPYDDVSKRAFISAMRQRNLDRCGEFSNEPSPLAIADLDQ